MACPILSEEQIVGASLAKGAEASPVIKDYANSADMVMRAFGLRRTLDILQDHSPALHAKVWEGISLETIQARGIKFKPEDANLVESTLTMKASEIADLEGFSDAEFEFLVNRRVWRKEASKAIRDEIDATKEYYGEHDMPSKVEHSVKVMQELEGALSGRPQSSGTGDLAVLGQMGGMMNDFIFKWNTAYHAVNLLDPIIIGSARVGFNRVMAAKIMIQTDAAVKEFLSSHDSKGPIAQLRHDITAEQQARASNPHVEQTAFSKVTNAIGKFQNKLPDLPSEKWNTNDALGASFINYGDRVGYKGGGTKFLKDLAEGKIDLDTQVEAYTDALQATQDMTGSGALGLDKDLIQRNVIGKYITQFTSQPYRVARMLKKWGDARDFKSIGTFVAMSAFVGGRAAIPQEVEFALQLAGDQGKAFLFAAQDILDGVNIGNKVFGRDLTDKLRYSMLPILGGQSTNIAVDEFTGRMRELEEHKLDKFTGSVAIMALSKMLGGGGGEIGKLQRESAAAAANEKKVSVYSKFGQKPIGSETIKGYSQGDALAAAILPGSSTKVGAIKKRIKRKADSK